MTLQEAKDLLNTCERYELRDHAFGDTEVSWYRTKAGRLEDVEETVADGYFGGSKASVSIYAFLEVDTCFTGKEANELRKCGTLKQVTRNDETGPDEYKEGVTMPGLTLEGVRKELEEDKWIDEAANLLDQM